MLKTNQKNNFSIKTLRDFLILKSSETDYIIIHNGSIISDYDELGGNFELLGYCDKSTEREVSVEDIKTEDVNIFKLNEKTWGDIVIRPITSEEELSEILS